MKPMTRLQLRDLAMKKKKEGPYSKVKGLGFMHKKQFCKDQEEKHNFFDRLLARLLIMELVSINRRTAGFIQSDDTANDISKRNASLVNYYEVNASAHEWLQDGFEPGVVCTCTFLF